MKSFIIYKPPCLSVFSWEKNSPTNVETSDNKNNGAVLQIIHGLQGQSDPPPTSNNNICTVQ